MAEFSIHFAFGMIVGTVLFASPVIKCWQNNQGVSGPMRRMLTASYVAGGIAAFPAVLKFYGCPEAVCSSVWMNAFLLYPLLNGVELISDRLLVGEIVLVGMFAVQCGVVMGALLQTRCGYRVSLYNCQGWRAVSVHGANRVKSESFRSRDTSSAALTDLR